MVKSKRISRKTKRAGRRMFRRARTRLDDTRDGIATTVEDAVSTVADTVRELGESAVVAASAGASELVAEGSATLRNHRRPLLKAGAATLSLALAALAGLIARREGVSVVVRRRGRTA
jgi:hypothetical protein